MTKENRIKNLYVYSNHFLGVFYSITEEEPGPLRGDFEGKSENKVSRTFSYLKSKMYKKSRVSSNPHVYSLTNSD